MRACLSAAVERFENQARIAQLRAGLLYRQADLREGARGGLSDLSGLGVDRGEAEVRRPGDADRRTTARAGE